MKSSPVATPSTPAQPNSAAMCGIASSTPSVESPSGASVSLVSASATKNSATSTISATTTIPSTSDENGPLPPVSCSSAMVAAGLMPIAITPTSTEPMTICAIGSSLKNGTNPGASCEKPIITSVELGSTIKAISAKISKIVRHDRRSSLKWISQPPMVPTTPTASTFTSFRSSITRREKSWPKSVSPISSAKLGPKASPAPKYPISAGSRTRRLSSPTVNAARMMNPVAAKLFGSSPVWIRLTSSLSPSKPSIKASSAARVTNCHIA
jgi:hypothetical protein